MYVCKVPTAHLDWFVVCIITITACAIQPLQSPVLTTVLPSFIVYPSFLLAYAIAQCLPAFLSQDPGQASGFS